MFIMENNTDHQGHETIVKNEDDDNEVTPLRDNETTPLCDDQNAPEGNERALSPEPTAGIPSGATGWDSDTEDQHAATMPTPPSPPPFNFIRIKKRSPSSDEELPPLRLSPADSQRTDVGTSMGSEPKNNQLTDEQYDTNLLPVFKKDERPELPLGFLDAFSEADFEVAGEQSKRNEMEDMNLDEPVNEEDNEYSQMNLEDLTHRRKELKKEVQKGSSGKKKKKHKNKHKHNPEAVGRKRHRSFSRSQSPPHPKESRIEGTSRHNDNIPDVKPTPLELGFVPVQDCEMQVKVINIRKLLPDAQADAPPPSIREKRRLAVERVKTVLSLLKLKASKAPETEFLVVDTIRQLPRDAFFMSCAIFENTSPLCNNFNVRYKFNSTSASNINITKWGLEPMPQVTTELLRLTGIDVARLMELKQNSKMPLQKLRLKEQAERAANQAVDETIFTGLYSSVSTQTDGRIGQNTRDVGVQAMPVSSSLQQGIFWLDSRFSETELSQQHANVMLALKELCASAPRSTYWADELFKALRPALAIKRAEVKTASN